MEGLNVERYGEIYPVFGLSTVSFLESPTCLFQPITSPDVRFSRKTWFLVLKVCLSWWTPCATSSPVGKQQVKLSREGSLPPFLDSSYLGSLLIGPTPPDSPGLWG